MFRTTAVPQEYLVLLAGAAAIGVVMALREERAEQAMLHMKEGHVLVQRQLKGIARTDGNKGQQLIQSQVVAGRETLQTPALQQPTCRERVGHV